MATAPDAAAAPAVPAGLRVISDDDFSKSSRGPAPLLHLIKFALTHKGKSFAIDITDENGSGDKITTQLYRAFKQLTTAESNGVALRTSKHEKVTDGETPYVAFRIVDKPAVS